MKEEFMLYFSHGDQMARTVLHCCSLEAILHIMPGTKTIKTSALLAIRMRSERFFY